MGKTFKVVACLAAITGTCGGLFVACGSPPNPTSPPNLNIASVKAPAIPRHRVRWLLAREGRFRAVGMIDTPVGRLYLADDGRRLLVPQQGPPLSSEYPLPKFMAGVLRKGSQVAFVDNFGKVYVADKPLGPVLSIRSGPQHYPHETATGKNAIVGISRDGLVLRTINLGRTWERVGLEIVGIPSSIALNQQGHGLLLTTPQALWLTQNDGATWRRIESTGDGVAAVTRSSEDKLAVASRAHWTAKYHVWEGERLRKAPVFKRLHPPLGGIVDQHLGPNGILQVALSPDDKGPALYANRELDGQASLRWEKLPFNKCVGAEVVGYGDTQYVSCTDEDTSAVTLWGRKGTGAWERERNPTKYPQRTTLVAGPNGWLMRGEWIRPGYGKSFIQLEGNPGWQHAMVADNVVHLVGQQGYGKWVYSTSSDANPKPRILELVGQDIQRPTLAMRPRGVVVLASGADSWLLFDPAKSNNGKLTAETIDFVPKHARRVLFAGMRGIALGSGPVCRLFETSNGGLDWKELKNESVPEAVCGSENISDTCTAHGCRLSHHVRLGWQLDAAIIPPPKPVKPKSVSPSIAEVENRTPKQYGTRFECTISGSSELLGAVKDTRNLTASIDVGGNLRWATSTLSNAGGGLVFERVGGLRTRLKLLGQTSTKNKTWVEHTRVLPEGYILARQTQAKLRAGQQKPPPARTQLAAHRWSDSKTWKGSVRHPAGHSGEPLLAFGKQGAVYRPAGMGKKAFVIHENGRVTRLELPATSTTSHTLVELPTTGTVGLASMGQWLEVGTRSRIRRWNLGDSGIHYGSWNGVPAVGVDIDTESGDWSRTLPFVVPLSDTNDPKGVFPISASALGEKWTKACEPRGLGGVTGWFYQEVEVMVSSLDDPKMNPLHAHVIVRVRPKKGPCVVGWITVPWMDQFAFLPADDLNTAYLFTNDKRTYGDWATLYVAPLRCSRKS